MCEVESYFTRLALVCTNLTMIGALLRMINKSINSERSSCRCIWDFFSKYSVEFLVYLTTMCVSILYHMCDDDDPCTEICVADWQTLYYLDFVFSYQTINTVIISFIDHETSPFKIVINLLYLGINSIFVTQFSDSGNTLYTNIYYIGLGISSVFLLVGKVIYLKYKGTLPHEYQYHFNCINFITGMTCVLLGVIFKILGSSIGYYYVFHSGWHFFIMLGIMMAVETFNMTTNLLFCKRKEFDCICNQPIN